MAADVTAVMNLDVCEDCFFIGGAGSEALEVGVELVKDDWT